MKRSLLLWGLLLTVGGFLLFRFGITSLYPEAVEYARAGNLQQFWNGLTVAQKLSTTAMEVPFFAAVVLIFVALVRLPTRKQPPRGNALGPVSPRVAHLQDHSSKRLEIFQVGVAHLPHHSSKRLEGFRVPHLSRRCFTRRVGA